MLYDVMFSNGKAGEVCYCFKIGNINQIHVNFTGLDGAEEAVTC